MTNDRKRRVFLALRGSRLTKSQLCERFAVSNDAMKTMLDALIEEGLVRRVGVSGCRVSYEAVPEEAKCPPST